MNVGNTHGIITLIFTCLSGAIFSTTLLFVPVLKNGKNKLNTVNPCEKVTFNAIPLFPLLE